LPQLESWLSSCGPESLIGLETWPSAVHADFVMKELPPEIRKNAEELRKLRLSQPWSSYEEALAQCRRVELCAALAEADADIDRILAKVPSVVPEEPLDRKVCRSGGIR